MSRPVDLTDEEWEHVLTGLTGVIEVVERRGDELVAALVLRSARQKFIVALAEERGL
jgi:hypothetical protein